MSKFERVLSDDEIDRIVNDFGCGGSCGNLFEIGARLEQAALAKLAEQEPVAWRINAKHFCGNFTKDKATAQYLLETDPANVTPLYAHPMPCASPTSNKEGCVSEIAESDMQRHIEYIKRYQKWRRGEDKTTTEAGLTPKQIGEALDWLIGVVEDHIADMRKMVTPLAQRKIQSVIDSGEYREMKGATVLVNKQGHAAIANYGGAFYWVDNKHLEREWDLAGEGDE